MIANIIAIIIVMMLAMIIIGYDHQHHYYSCNSGIDDMETAAWAVCSTCLVCCVQELADRAAAQRWAAFPCPNHERGM